MNGGTLPGAARSFPTSTAVAALVNGASTIKNAVTAVFPVANAATVLSGAMTAATLKTFLSVSGRGRINFAGVSMPFDTTSRTMRMRITLDDLVIVDATCAPSGAQNGGLVVIGGGSGEFQPVDFSRSLRIEAASSLSETDKLQVGWNCEVWA